MTKQITATFRTSPEIMADVSAYDQRELLVVLFNHAANFLSVGSGWRFDSIQSLTISLCPSVRLSGPGPSYKRLSRFTVKQALISKILKTISASYGPFSRTYIELISTPINCTTTTTFIYGLAKMAAVFMLSSDKTPLNVA